MSYMFMDESMDESMDLSALTGIIVPVTSYPRVRSKVRQIVWRAIEPPVNTVPRPVELHARNLLCELEDISNDELDDRRVACFEECVKIVNEERLQIVRIGYTNRKEISNLLRGDSKLYGLNFMGILSSISDFLENSLIQPVMDGIPDVSYTQNNSQKINSQLVRAFSLSIHGTYFAAQLQQISISIKNFSNVLEPLFAESSTSLLLQLVDMISYLLLQNERLGTTETENISEFKRRVLAEARKIQPDLVRSWTGRMQAGQPT